MYALDTNTLIYFFKGMGNIAARLFSESPRNIAIPAIVLFELETGIAKTTDPGKRAAQLDGLLTTVSILPFGLKAAKSAAEIRTDLERKGLPIGPFDTLIAGTVLAEGATLVTHNIREFSRVGGLSMEDWF